MGEHPRLPEEVEGFAAHQAYLTARVNGISAAWACMPVQLLLLISFLILFVQTVISLALKYERCAKCVNFIPGLGHLYRFAQETQDANAEETVESYDQVIAQMIEDGMVATYNFKHHRKYGGDPQRSINVDEIASTKESTRTPTPPTEVDSWPPFEYDELGSTTRRPLQMPTELPAPIAGEATNLRPERPHPGMDLNPVLWVRR